MYLLVHVSGTGMSGLAKLLLEGNERVVGWDDDFYPRVEGLMAMGMTFHKGEVSSSSFVGVDCIIYSALKSKQEVLETFCHGSDIPCYSLYEFLNICCKNSDNIAVTGTYGKTTVSALIGHVMEEMDRDPTIFTGGIIKKYKSSIKKGNSDYWIIEISDSKDNLFVFNPFASILLNIERTEQIENFRKFSSNTKRNIFYNSDDLNCRNAVKALQRTISFGIQDSKAEFQARNISVSSQGLKFDFFRREVLLGTMQSSLIGYHNVYNILATCAYCFDNNIAIKDIQNSLINFYGIEDRFDIHVRTESLCLVTDIAHHPIAISFSISAAQMLGMDNIYVIYQPHLYEEITYLAQYTSEALEKADKILFTSVKSLKEKKRLDVSSELFVKKQQQKNDKWAFALTDGAIIEWLSNTLRPKSVVIYMGMHLSSNLLLDIKKIISLR